MTTKLAHQTQKTAGIPNGMRTATIVAVTGSAVTISVSGGQFTAGVGVVTSYAPEVGDVVAVFRQDSSWLILGRTSPSPMGDWVRFSSLSGGYQNGWFDRGTVYPPGQYRIAGNEVQIVGQINNAGTPTSGSVIVAGLPAPPGEMGGIICAQGTTRPSLHVDLAGALRIYDGSTTGLLQFAGSYFLDNLIG